MVPGAGIDTHQEQMMRTSVRFENLRSSFQSERQGWRALACTSECRFCPSKNEVAIVMTKENLKMVPGAGIDTFAGSK